MQALEECPERKLLAVMALIVVPGASTYSSYATATRASCGTCHVNPGGGGTLTPAGECYKQNGQLSSLDNTKPVINAPADFSVVAAAMLPMTVNIGMAKATDDSGIAPVITNDAPAKFELGDTIVTWTATDGSDNSATATQKVTVTPASVTNNTPQ